MRRVMRARGGSRAERGQSLVEMALILPVLLLIVLGTLEFGFVFDHHLTLEYGSREGARAGSALANGGGALGCGGGQSPDRAEVDPRIVAAVQRVLTSPGSPVDVADVSEIRIYRAGNDGQELGPVNRWVYAAGAGPTVDGLALNFVMASEGYPACGRDNSATNTHSVGVSVTYTYAYQTALPAFIGVNALTMTDRTVMQLNPTN